MLRDILNRDHHESEIGDYLVNNQIILLETFGIRDDACILRELPLAKSKKDRPDFFVDFALISKSRRDTYKWDCIIIELKKVDRIFNKNGNLSSPLNTAIIQVIERKIWLDTNISYFIDTITDRTRKTCNIIFKKWNLNYPRAVNIDYKIIIGCNTPLSEHQNDLRRKFRDNDIDIVLYERLCQTEENLLKSRV